MSLTSLANPAKSLAFPYHLTIFSISKTLKTLTNYGNNQSFSLKSLCYNIESCLLRNISCKKSVRKSSFMRLVRVSPLRWGSLFNINNKFYIMVTLHISLPDYNDDIVTIRLMDSVFQKLYIEYGIPFIASYIYFDMRHMLHYRKPFLFSKKQLKKIYNLLGLSLDYSVTIPNVNKHINRLSL